MPLGCSGDSRRSGGSPRITHRRVTSPPPKETRLSAAFHRIPSGSNGIYLYRIPTCDVDLSTRAAGLHSLAPQPLFQGSLRVELPTLLTKNSLDAAVLTHLWHLLEASGYARRLHAAGFRTAPPNSMETPSHGARATCQRRERRERRRIPTIERRMGGGERERRKGR